MMTIENGTYQARAVTAALGETTNGKEQVGVEFELQDGTGRHITWYGYFTEKAVDRTLESLRICGWKGSDLLDLSGIDENEVSIVVEAEEYDGKWRSKVKWINGGNGLALARQLSPEKASAFAARMKGSILAYDQKAGNPVRKTAAPPPHRNADADVFSDDKPPF